MPLFSEILSCCKNKDDDVIEPKSNNMSHAAVVKNPLVELRHDVTVPIQQSDSCSSKTFLSQSENLEQIPEYDAGYLGKTSDINNYIRANAEQLKKLAEREHHSDSAKSTMSDDYEPDLPQPEPTMYLAEIQQLMAQYNNTALSGNDAVMHAENLQ